MTGFGKWKSHNGGEIPAKLVGRMVQIQCHDQTREDVEKFYNPRNADDLNWSHDAPNAYPIIAYRIVKKTKAPKVEKREIKCHIFDGVLNGLYVAERHSVASRCLANITLTLSITDGRVTACDTIIHDAD